MSQSFLEGYDVFRWSAIGHTSWHTVVTFGDLGVYGPNGIHLDIDLFTLGVRRLCRTHERITVDIVVC